MGGDEEGGGSSRPFGVCRSSQSLPLCLTKPVHAAISCLVSKASLPCPPTQPSPYTVGQHPTYMPVLETVQCSLMEYITYSHLPVRSSEYPGQSLPFAWGSWCLEECLTCLLVAEWMVEPWTAPDNSRNLPGSWSH